jgi:hypothetical protein
MTSENGTRKPPTKQPKPKRVRAWAVTGVVSNERIAIFGIYEYAKTYRDRFGGYGTTGRNCFYIKRCLVPADTFGGRGKKA